MRVLLIYSEFPESIRFYAFDDLSPEEIEVLRRANDNLLHEVENDDHIRSACQAVLEAVTEAKYASGDFNGWLGIDWAGRWLTKEIPAGALPGAGAFDQVFTTGAIM